MITMSRTTRRFCQRPKEDSEAILTKAFFSRGCCSQAQVGVIRRMVQTESDHVVHIILCVSPSTWALRRFSHMFYHMVLVSTPTGACPPYRGCFTNLFLGYDVQLLPRSVPW
jgi:hypothetical protein